ncbi:Dynamin-related protein 1E [Olea europaea subsp. europaea]|uniref:Dynamin-related protein 1E n=1 Tax=Olea europaea subsp. europaea TaxID=158383 RepID=A0A8S0V8U1_OLEEU|nr:Dynamin-related protein 1E [Olea europaea subsp. europaea]
MSAAHAPNTDSSYLSGASESGNSDVGTSGTSSIHSNNTDMRERGKSSLRALYFKGVVYPMKSTATNTLNKIVIRYQVVYCGQLDKDAVLNNCSNVIYDIANDYRREDFFTTAVTLLKEKHHGILVTRVQLRIDLCEVNKEALENFGKGALRKLPFHQHLSLQNVRKIISENDNHQLLLIAREQGYQLIKGSSAQTSVDEKQLSSMLMEGGADRKFTGNGFWCLDGWRILVDSLRQLHNSVNCFLGL